MPRGNPAKLSSQTQSPHAHHATIYRGFCEQSGERVLLGSFAWWNFTSINIFWKQDGCSKAYFYWRIFRSNWWNWLFAFVLFRFRTDDSSRVKALPGRCSQMFHVFWNSHHFDAKLFWKIEVRTSISGDFTSIMGGVDVGVYKCIYSYASSLKESSFHVRYWNVFPPRVPDGSLYALFLFGPVDSGCPFLPFIWNVPVH